MKVGVVAELVDLLLGLGRSQRDAVVNMPLGSVVPRHTFKEQGFEMGYEFFP